MFTLTLKCSMRVKYYIERVISRKTTSESENLGFQVLKSNVATRLQDAGSKFPRKSYQHLSILDSASCKLDSPTSNFLDIWIPCIGGRVDLRVKDALGLNYLPSYRTLSTTIPTNFTILITIAINFTIIVSNTTLGLGSGVMGLKDSLTVDTCRVWA